MIFQYLFGAVCEIVGYLFMGVSQIGVAAGIDHISTVITDPIDAVAGTVGWAFSLLGTQVYATIVGCTALLIGFRTVALPLLLAKGWLVRKQQGYIGQEVGLGDLAHDRHLRRT